MALNVKLYRNFSKRDRSTLQPTSQSSADSFTCTLKAGCSITDPVIEILDIATNPATAGYNYAYITQLQRYYFISNWRWDMGIWSASMSVDVLASYKTQIGALSKYIKRCYSEFDTNLTDTVYPTEATANVSYISGDNPFRVAPFGSFIVGIVGKSQANVPNIGGVNYYLFSYTQMAAFIDYLMSGAFSALMKDDSAGLTEAVVKAIASPTDYITNAMWFPFEITGATSANKVQPLIGWWDTIAPISGGLTPLGGGFMDSLKFSPSGFTSAFTLTDHPQISRGIYLNSSPYSEYIFHLEPWGDIPLQGSELLSSRTIRYDILVEGLSGIGALEIYTGSKLLSRNFAQVGVSLSIAQIINDFGSMSTTSTIVGAAAGALSSLRNMSASEMLDNVLLRLTGHSNKAKKKYGSIGSDILSGIEAYNADVQTAGVSGSLISYTGSYIAASSLYTQGAYIKVIRHNLVAEDRAEIGRPLYSVRTINTLTGFVSCIDGEHDIPALEGEKEEISAYLSEGFFYE